MTSCLSVVDKLQASVLCKNKKNVLKFSIGVKRVRAHIITCFTYSWLSPHIVPQSINYYCCCHYRSYYYSSFGNYLYIKLYIKRCVIIYKIERTGVIWCLICSGDSQIRRPTAGVNSSNALVTHPSVVTGARDHHTINADTKMYIIVFTRSKKKKKERGNNTRTLGINCPRPYIVCTLLFSFALCVSLKQKNKNYQLENHTGCAIESKLDDSTEPPEAFNKIIPRKMVKIVPRSYASLILYLSYCS